MSSLAEKFWESERKTPNRVEHSVLITNMCTGHDTEFKKMEPGVGPKTYHGQQDLKTAADPAHIGLL